MNSLFGGDFRFFWHENIHFFWGIPQAWDTSLNTGIGQPQLNTLWITSYLNATASFAKFGFSWNSIAFIFWLLPALLIAFFSVYTLFRKLIHKNRVYASLAGILYIFNTYFLLLFFGGQIGIVFAYALFPLVIKSFLAVFEKPNLRLSLIAGLTLTCITLFDPRITYLSLVVIFFAFFFFIFFRANLKKQILFSFLVPFILTSLLHSFWLIPLLFFRAPLVPDSVSINTTSDFVFFSFADFTHAFSLLHPNWPENIFGKVSFMKAEFLIMPLLAYSSLLFLNSKVPAQKSKIYIKRIILFFALLGLVSAFLAKGANEPFANINLFLFDYIPGMNMFRDPTKWYILIALSYSVLIPFSLWRTYEFLSQRTKFSIFHFQFFIKSKIFNFQNLFILFTTFYFLFLIYPFISQPWIKLRPVPQEYVQLKDFLHNSKSFSRTLWIPQWQRYGYFSNMHPAIGRGELIGNGNPTKLAKKLSNPKLLEVLRQFNVRYIIIPFDSEGEIFTSDRRYDDRQYQKIKNILDHTKEIRKVKQFGKITVYELKGSGELFHLKNSGKDVQWWQLNGTNYKIRLQKEKNTQTVIFSMAYDRNWKASFGGKTVNAERYANNLNSFAIPSNINNVDIFYQPQRLVNIGLVISFITLVFVLGSLAFLNFRVKTKDVKIKKGKR